MPNWYANTSNHEFKPLMTSNLAQVSERAKASQAREMALFPQKIFVVTKIVDTPLTAGHEIR